MENSVVIVGAGHGGFQTAATLRHNGFDGRIVLVNDEPAPPYQRPPLSKEYLEGKMSLDQLLMRPESFYADQRIELMSSARVAGIDRSAKEVLLESGAKLPYGHLVLAMGARNRMLRIPGSDLDGVSYIRTLAETDDLRGRLADAGNIVVIGAGFIGLEFASVATARGAKVHIVEALDRPMSRVMSAEMSRHFADYHQGAGAQFTFGAQAARILGENGRVTGVEMADGGRLPADLVIISVGIVPNTELAQQAGLPIADGIVVDERLLTSDPSISAIGDCASFPSPHSGRPLRLESVQNAFDQAKCVADRLTGKDHVYDSVPWFWSDQGPLKLQIAGVAAGYTKPVVRGSVESGSFSVFCFAGDDLLGIESVNRAGDHMFGRRLLAARGKITPAQAADEGFDLKKHLASLRAAAPAKPR
jgi:3-phenylpropionate/trans-cinnamate dioxygenase ferredoxin reductase subunit